MKKKKIKFIWTCSNFKKHQHRWKWTAWLCGRIQYYLALAMYFNKTKEKGDGSSRD